MGNIWKALLAWFSLFLPALALSPANLQGPFRVEQAIDGDTLVVAGERVRLIGVDAPESSANDRARREAAERGLTLEAMVRMGQRATTCLRDLLGGRPVHLELDVQERDRYRRVLAYLYVEDPKGAWGWGGRRLTQLNWALVRLGCAWVYTVPPNVRWAELLLKAERAARREGRGVHGEW